MNFWTNKSIKLANGKEYLDKLYNVYPIKQNEGREIDDLVINKIKESYTKKDKINLVKNLLEVEVFPIKDSYIAYFRKDKTAIERNPKTVERVADLLLEIPYDEIVERCKTPKESNRQIGPMFKNWVQKGDLGLKVYNDVDEFEKNDKDGILNASDLIMANFAKKKFNYDREKGIDFIARKNKKYLIGEAKFITDFGGHQNAQLDDAISTIKTFDIKKIKKYSVIPIVIADGVLYIENDGKMYNLLRNNNDMIIISSLLLKELIHII